MLPAATRTCDYNAKKLDWQSIIDTEITGKDEWLKIEVCGYLKRGILAKLVSL